MEHLTGLIVWNGAVNGEHAPFVLNVPRRFGTVYLDCF